MPDKKPLKAGNKTKADLNSGVVPERTVFPPTDYRDCDDPVTDPKINENKARTGRNFVNSNEK